MAFILRTPLESRFPQLVIFELQMLYTPVSLQLFYIFQLENFKRNNRNLPLLWFQYMNFNRYAEIIIHEICILLRRDNAYLPRTAIHAILGIVLIVEVTLKIEEKEELSLQARQRTCKLEQVVKSCQSGTLGSFFTCLTKTNGM